LNVSRALGTASVALVKNLEESKRALQNQLADLFSGITPGRTVDPKEFTNLVNSAVELRNEMATELAVYYCFWHSPQRERVNMSSTFHDYQGDLTGDSLPLTIFPGFGRKIRKQDGSLGSVCVTSSKVELE
jgi:hypothetical protein